MSIKLVDSLQSMGDFPVAFANSIECADGTDLETKLSTLNGGGGASYITLSQEEYDNLEDSIKLDGQEYRTYDTGHIYKLGVEYGKDGVQISDNETVEDKTWSSKKTSGKIEELSNKLGEKVDYKVVVEDGTRYVEDIVTQDINTWLPNDNSSILINLKKTNGINYLNFQLLCNKKDSKNWSCIVNGAANELWKIRYVNGVRYIDELATMDKVSDGYARVLKNADTDTNEAMFIAYKNRDLFGIRIYKDDYSEHELKFSASGISYVKDGVTVWTK